jgi:hypothetical protein
MAFEHASQFLALNCPAARLHLHKSDSATQHHPRIESDPRSSIWRGERYATFFGPVAAYCRPAVPKVCAQCGQSVRELCAADRTGSKCWLSRAGHLPVAHDLEGCRFTAVSRQGGSA